MKKMIYLIAVIITTAFASCKKDKINLTPLASLNITNAVIGGTTAKLGSNATTISNNNYTAFALLVGTDPIYIYPSTDSLHPYVNSSLTVNQSDLYSLFVAGTPAAIDTVLIKENIPYRTDSTAGIRFINLAPNTSSKPINITLSATPTMNEASGLAYKSYTGFNSYPGLYNSTYTFQVRNDTCASPKPPLTTFSLTAAQVPRFANITLVIRQNGTGLAVFSVKNDR